MIGILLPIKPKYVAEILNGRKTIEIRKTMPKCDLPIDVYIYCTKDKKYANLINRGGFLTGMVVAKFTLNKVEEWDIWQEDLEEKLKLACLSIKEFDDYSKGQVAYAWHISNLEIFDKPKELYEFESTKQCLVDVIRQTQPILQNIRLTKAPQSFCYIEVS